MDSRLVLTVLLVTLSWMSLGTDAQNTTAPMLNMTNNMTGPMNNMTNNMTGPMNNMTGPMNNMTGPMNNMTGPMNNMTGPMNNMTGPMNNMTGLMPNGTTPAPPLMLNTTVEVLTTTIDRQGCGSQQLCAAQPSDCDPSTQGSCFFLGVMQTEGQNFRFALSGNAAGYIAASLSPDATAGGNDTTFVCANNGSVQFFGAFLNNGQLIPMDLQVNSVRGRVNGSTIQCTFAATVPGPTARATATNFAVSVSTGDFNPTTGTLGSPVAQFRSGVVDLSNPNSTISNLISNGTTTTTAAPTVATTSSPTTAAGHGVSLQQSLSRALLIALGVVGLALL